jgi:5-methyltetrahydropteroyltriglutamate--homocysteine methyltransferase
MLAARNAADVRYAITVFVSASRTWLTRSVGTRWRRGNWSRDETTLLSGGYQALKAHLDRLTVTQLVLEYATDRAGDVIAFPEKELGLGVVNPRTDAIESASSIRSAVEQALRVYPESSVFLNPNCGFGTFSSRPMNPDAVAAARISAMVAAARDLRSADTCNSRSTRT